MSAFNPSQLLDMSIKGICIDPVLFQQQVQEITQQKQLLKWKQQNIQLPLIIALTGGTGTGKSTLFNALIEQKISAESVKRPTTSGGIAYIYKEWLSLFKDILPFSTQIQSLDIDSSKFPNSGTSKTLTLVPHESFPLFPMIIDSPDVDSVCLDNKKHAQKIFLLADIIVYVTSIEKYADQEPLSIVFDAQKNQKQLIVALNKCDDKQLANNIYHQLKGIVQLHDMPFFAIPRKKKSSDSDYLEAVAHFKDYLIDISSKSRKKIKKQAIKSLSSQSDLLILKLQEEFDNEMIAYKEIEHVLSTAGKISKDMIDQLPATFNRSYFDECIKPHIKEIYKRHDVLAPVRNWIIETLKKPFFLIPTPHKKTNHHDYFPQMDLTPVLTALGEYQYYVKKNATADLFQEYIRLNAPELDQETVKSLFQNKMIAINQWLTDQFQILNKGIPVQKRIGIHALSIIWGAAIVGLETISGGGLSPIELALDSIIAPYITAGATELFVVSELKNIVHQLRSRYINALHAIINHQHNQYLSLLEQLKPHQTRPRYGLIWENTASNNK